MAAQFNVQNDAGTVALANAYVTLLEFKQYHDNVGNIYSNYNDAQIQTAIVRATFYLDQRFTFPGRKAVVVDPTIGSFDVLTFIGQPADTQTVTIDGKVYTFQTVLTNVNGNVLI